MVRTVEAKSAHDCQRIKDLVIERAGTLLETEFSIRQQPGYAGYAAASEARYYDLSLLPCAQGASSVQEVAQTVVFESGRPAIIVPPSAKGEPIKHVAIAWDGSPRCHKGARGHDAAAAGQHPVDGLTVLDEKPLERKDLGGTLVTHLQRRGFDAHARDCALSGRTISGALQDAALEAGANLLVMGGFGHSRVGISYWAGRPAACLAICAAGPAVPLSGGEMPRWGRYRGSRDRCR